MRLDGEVVLVTGSSRGLGRATALRLAMEGARVVIHGKTDGEQLRRVADELRRDRRDVLVTSGDVGDEDAVERIFDATLRSFGTLDVLVNNAAWSSAKGHLLEVSPAHWDEVMRSNLRSVYLCTARAAKAMIGQKKAGTIVNVSSFGAVRAHRNMCAYDAAKGGVEAFTRASAVDLAPFGIRVNAVGPGAIETETLAAQGPEARARRAASVPLGRSATPDDIARVIAFLASEDAGYMTGQTVYADGGGLAQLRAPQIDAPLPPAVAALLRG